MLFINFEFLNLRNISKKYKVCLKTKPSPSIRWQSLRICKTSYIRWFAIPTLISGEYLQ